MDVFLTGLRGPSERAINQGRRAPGLGEHVNLGGRAIGLGEHASDLGARAKVSRARAVLTFLCAKNLTAAKAASQSGFMAAEGRRRRAIERTVPSRAYGRWKMFDQTFISAGSQPARSHGAGGADRVFMAFRRD
jgi:hypothetical protein